MRKILNVMKRKMLSCLLAVSLIFCGLPAQTGYARDYPYAYEEADCIINDSIQFAKSHYINGYCFFDIDFYEYKGSTWMEGKVKNVSDVARGITLPRIYFYDDEGLQLANFGGIIGECAPGQSVDFMASATTTGIVQHTFDYTMVFSPKDSLNMDEEIIIKKGVVCTSHDIRENDTITLVCEESGEGVTYQWFWGITAGTDERVIYGATDRRLTISDVYLDQTGQFYYCQICKNGKLEYTDRFEMVVLPADPEPSPVPETTATPQPLLSPSPSASPTFKASPKPTLEPTATPESSPSVPAGPDSSAMPDTAASPEPSKTPDTAVSPKPSESSGEEQPPVETILPPVGKPTAKPDSTGRPTQPSVPSPETSPSESPDVASSHSPGPQVSPSPEKGPSVSPNANQTAVKVTGIKVQQTDSLNVKLTWKKTAADKIAVLRAGKKSGPYDVIKQLSGSRTGYIDKTVKRGKTYYYKIAAYNGNRQATPRQSDLTAKKITINHLIPPVITISKGRAGRQKYVQILLKKYEGQYADIYMKTDRKYKKLVIKKRTIRNYRKKYRFRYGRGGVTLSFRVRTYRIENAKKKVSAYSKVVKIKI